MPVHETASPSSPTRALATACLVVANIAVFSIVGSNGGGSAPPDDILLAHGALFKAALAQGETWRLLTAGFLHPNLVALGFDMACLIAWGATLEKRIGPFYMLVIYFASLLAGGMGSVLTHPGDFVGLGASGAVAGLLGALVALWILGKVQLWPPFVVASLGLLVASSVFLPGMDWRTNLGGFTAGIAGCAVLDLFVEAIQFAFRNEFPEFVKVNAAILVLAFGLATLRHGSGFDPQHSTADVALFILAMSAVAIKGLDLLLAKAKGLAVIVMLFALGNAAIPMLYADELRRVLSWSCHSAWLRSLMAAIGPSEPQATLLCRMRDATPIWAAAIVFLATLVVYRRSLSRGSNNVEFTNGTFVAKRKRSSGL